MAISRSLAALPLPDRDLILAASDAAKNAYAPYSGFAVGAAVLTKDGHVFTGANLENASYGLSICAEVAALTAANSAGHYGVVAIAIVGYRFAEPTDAAQVVTPCGRCRQMIGEAAQVSGVDIRVFSCSGDLAVVTEATVSELLPDAFGPANLGLTDGWKAAQAKLRSELHHPVRRPTKVG